MLVLYIACLPMLVCGWNHKRNHERYTLDIKGPKKSDRIAIVGAGPAGIHMALALKELGYLHINIFEASDRIGGKSLSINYRGAVQDLGTVYLSPDFEENVRKLVEKYSYSEFVDLPSPSVWFTQDNVPFNFTTYVLKETLAFLNTTNQTLAMNKLISAVKRYQDLHVSLFGSYPGELMPRPNKTVLEIIKGTSKEFLIRENLYILRPLLVASQTMLGYGQIDEIPAFYTLLWNTPKLMNSLLLRAKGAPEIGVCVIAEGFQGLWEKIVQHERLQVSLRSEVLHIKRERNSKEVIVRHRNGPHWPEEIVDSHFDFLIWSPELQQSLDTIEATKRERELFSSARPQYFTTTLLDEHMTLRGASPIDYWVNNVLEKGDHSVWAQRDSFSVLNYVSGFNYQRRAEITGNDDCQKRSTVAYQLGSNKPNNRVLSTKLKAHYKKLGGNVRVKLRKTWRYFPRYSVEEIQKGVIWDILEEQGQDMMWYIGSSVIFESAKSVIEYNKLLIREMKHDDRYSGSDSDDHRNHL